MKQKRYTFYKTWLLFAFIGHGLILYTSLIDLGIEKEHVPFQDKFMHLGVYFIASFYTYMLFYKKVFLSAFSIFLYSFLIEILQGMSSIRSFDWMDLVFNFLGILIAIVFQRKFSRFLFIIDHKLKKIIL